MLILIIYYPHRQTDQNDCNRKGAFHRWKGGLEFARWCIKCWKQYIVYFGTDGSEKRICRTMNSGTKNHVRRVGKKIRLLYARLVRCLPMDRYRVVVYQPSERLPWHSKGIVLI